MHIVRLAFKSILNRKFTIALTIFSIALSILLLLAVERLRHDAQESFANTISGTDLIVGARSSPVQLMLYSVFRIGNPTNNVSWESYQDIKSKKLVAWTIPISLGDSHRGFRVLGTNTDYFRYYQYSKDQGLVLAEGRQFSGVFDAVLGADVAKELGYQLDQEIILAHGTGEVSFVKHSEKPFRIVGILEKTGTPVDRTVHVKLEGIEAVHVGWQSNVPPSKLNKRSIKRGNSQLQPKTITAALVGLKSRLAAFRVQRAINEYRAEPLVAVLPGVALQELWDTLAIAQRVLIIISILVVLVSVSGMATAILTSLNERQREMAVLRSVGARPWHIFALFIGESGAIMLISSALGVIALYIVQLVAQPIIQTQLGLYLPINAPTMNELMLIAGAIFIGLVVGLIPAYRAYKNSLADGLTIRI